MNLTHWRQLAVTQAAGKTYRIDGEADLVQDVSGEGREPGTELVAVQSQHG